VTRFPLRPAKPGAAGSFKQTIVMPKSTGETAAETSYWLDLIPHTLYGASAVYQQNATFAAQLRGLVGNTASTLLQDTQSVVRIMAGRAITRVDVAVDMTIDTLGATPSWWFDVGASTFYGSTLDQVFDTTATLTTVGVQTIEGQFSLDPVFPNADIEAGVFCNFHTTNCSGHFHVRRLRVLMPPA
jgi:hypothetical protein